MDKTPNHGKCTKRPIKERVQFLTHPNRCRFNRAFSMRIIIWIICNTNIIASMSHLCPRNVQLGPIMYLFNATRQAVLLGRFPAENGIWKAWNPTTIGTWNWLAFIDNLIGRFNQRLERLFSSYIKHNRCRIYGSYSLWVSGGVISCTDVLSLVIVFSSREVEIT
uniref:Uncharacterized protein n=1 Tax=Meloidogyne incognita TaxID=6306 RepID=A0A914KFD9_MELIC